MASTNFDSAYRSNNTFTADETTGITVTGWANYDVLAGWQGICQIITGEGNDIILECQNDSGDGDLGLFVQGDGWSFLDPGFKPEVSTWFFWAIALYGGNCYIYISTDRSTLNLSNSMATGVSTWNATEVAVAQNTFVESFNGQLHHVRVFERLLTAYEMLGEMNNTYSIASPDAAWELYDASLVDSSGNGKDLTGSGGTIVAGASSAPAYPFNAALAGVSI